MLEIYIGTGIFLLLGLGASIWVHRARRRALALHRWKMAEEAWLRIAEDDAADLDPTMRVFAMAHAVECRARQYQ